MNKTFIALLGLAATAALMPSAAFAQSSWSVTIGSGGGYYGQPYGGGYSQHDDEHDQLDDEHNDVHDDLDQEHAQAHQYWMSDRAHRRLHRHLNEEHAGPSSARASGAFAGLNNEQCPRNLVKIQRAPHRADVWLRRYDNRDAENGACDERSSNEAARRKGDGSQRRENAQRSVSKIA